jgi:uncharacterized Zn-binding protein involved in type VI secretion
MPWVGGNRPKSAATPAAAPPSSAAGTAVRAAKAAADGTAPAGSHADTSGAKPAISLAGKGTVTAMFANTVNTIVDPFQQVFAPGKNVLERVSSAVNGVMGLMNAPAALMDTGLAALTAPLAAVMPSLPAATLTALSVGIPHPHSHPPSLIPPAPPVPLPSIGTVMMAGCLSVLIGGVPAARCGDVGLVVTCGSLMPPMMIFMGSSNVFIGGKRAARMTDITIHCMPAAKGAPTTMAGVVKASAVGAGVSLLGAAASASAGSGLAAAMQAAQAAADIAAEAIKALLGKDPGLAPDMGALMIGNPTVLIGGFPLPDSSVVLEGLKKLARALAKGIRGGRAQGKLFCAECM